MRLLRNTIAFNYGFWIAAFLCLLSAGCNSPVKEEAPTKKVEAYDEIHDRMMTNVVIADDPELRKIREMNIETEKIIEGLDRLNDGLERLTETISAN